MLSLVLIATACTGTSSGNPADERASTTTTTTAADTTSSTSVGSTTTTTEGGPCVEPLDDDRQTILKPGCLYFHESQRDVFGLDLEVSVEREGWREAINSPRVMRFLGPEVDGLTAQLDVVTMPSGTTVDELVERLTTRTRSETPLLHTEPALVVLNGREALAFDVYHGYDPEDEDPCGEVIEPGDVLAQEEQFFGPELCVWARTWVIDVDGVPVVLIGQDDNNGNNRRNLAESGEFPDSRSTLGELWDELADSIRFP